MNKPANLHKSAVYKMLAEEEENKRLEKAGKYIYMHIVPALY